MPENEVEVEVASTTLAEVLKSAQRFKLSEPGYDLAEVDTRVEELERELRELRERSRAAEGALQALESRHADLERAEAEAAAACDQARVQAETVLTEAKERAKDLYARAERERIALVAEQRVELAREHEELSELRGAVAAETEALTNMELHLDTRISGPSIELVRIVDGAGGIEPESEATQNLLDFARLLLAAQTPFGDSGAAVSVHPETEIVELEPVTDRVA